MIQSSQKPILLAMLLGLCLAAVGTSSAIAAEQCRDEKGKFLKCPPPATAAQKCRDIKTKKFAKCGTAGTEPVPAKKN
jgi:hypothetical protein